jgi:hypothetical protein
MLVLNPTLPPTVDEFRKMFPEFAAVSDDQIEFYIFEGMQWVDTFWEPIDAKLGVLYAAAHFLTVHDIAAGGVITDPADSGSGIGSSDPDVGKIWVKSVRFRDRQVTYDRVGTGADKAQSGGAGSGAPSDDYWEATLYGQQYLKYRRRNVPHVAVV